MPTVDAETLMHQVGEPADLEQADAEQLLGQSINLLNTYGADLPSLSSGRVGVSSKESGAILSLGIELYYHNFRDRVTSNAQGFTVMTTEGSVSALNRLAKELAENLKTGDPGGRTG